MKSISVTGDLVDSPEAADRYGRDSFGASLRRLWRARLFIALVTACTTALGVIAVLMSPKRYEASAIVAPVANDSASKGLGSLVSQFGGLASLAGIAMPNSTERAEIVATLQSETLTQAYIAGNDLLPILFAEHWDAAKRQWQGGQAPTLWKASQYFKKRIRTVVEEKKTGLVKVTITWTDPKQAAEWANGLVALANEYLRAKAVEESDRNIAYLNRQASRSEFMEVRAAIYAVLETQIKKAMLARESKEYALKVVDRAFTPEKAVSPRPVLWVFTAFLLGLIMSVVAVLAAHSLTAED